MPESRRVLVHKQFLSWLRNPRTPRQMRKKAIATSWQVFRFGQPSAVRPVQEGPNQTWRRTPIGNHGKQFYLWWIPHSGLRRLVEQPEIFDALPTPEGAVVYFRCVRHHDETNKPLSVDIQGDWSEMTPEILTTIESAPVETVNAPTDMSAQTPVLPTVTPTLVTAMSLEPASPPADPVESVTAIAPKKPSYSEMRLLALDTIKTDTTRSWSAGEIAEYLGIEKKAEKRLVQYLHAGLSQLVIDKEIVVASGIPSSRTNPQRFQLSSGVATPNVAAPSIETTSPVVDLAPSIVKIREMILTATRAQPERIWTVREMAEQLGLVLGSRAALDVHKAVTRFARENVLHVLPHTGVPDRNNPRRFTLANASTVITAEKTESPPAPQKRVDSVAQRALRYYKEALEEEIHSLPKTSIAYSVLHDRLQAATRAAEALKDLP